MKKQAVIISLALAGLSQAAPVITWVSPYNMDTDKVILQNNTPNLAKALTHLSLQLWNTSATGDLSYAALDNTPTYPTDTDIQYFVSWAHSNGIKTILTVYNNSEAKPGWDWTTISSVISSATARSNLANQVAAKVKSLCLDGAEMDLEESTGTNMAGTEATNYISLIQALQTALNGKELFVDSFHYIYNGPNTNQWAQLQQYTTGITSMGYSDIGYSAPSCSPTGTWCQYQSQVTTMGNGSKLILGMDGSMDTWQSKTSAAQISGTLSLNGNVGIGIWELGDMTKTWLSSSISDSLALVKQKGGYTPPPTTCDTSTTATLTRPNSADLLAFNLQGMDINALGDVQIRLIDATGRQVWQNSRTGVLGTTHFDLPSGLNSGVYFLELHNGSQFSQERLSLY